MSVLEILAGGGETGAPARAVDRRPILAQTRHPAHGKSTRFVRPRVVPAEP